MQKSTFKKAQIGMLLVGVFVITFSFYIEFLNQLKPCPLCIMQRICAIFFGLACFTGLMVSNIRQAKMVSLVQCILSGLGIYFASRQIWLQSLPAEDMAQCMPGLQAMLQYFSWDVILKSFFWGTSDCSHVDWRWYGLSIPVWSEIYFVVMFLIGAYHYLQALLQGKQRKKF